MSRLAEVLIGIGASLLVGWLLLVVFLVIVRPKGSRLSEAIRLLPDTLGLLRRLGADKALPRGVRTRLWLLFLYLAVPFDLVPDFIPVLGYADDAIIVCLVLRSVVRRAGPEALKKHWQGSPDGLRALWRLAGLPSSPEQP